MQVRDSRPAQGSLNYSIIRRGRDRRDETGQDSTPSAVRARCKEYCTRRQSRGAERRGMERSGGTG